MCVFQRLILHYDARMQQFPQRLAEHDKSVSPKRLITLVTMGGLSQVGSSREGVEAFVARWSFTTKVHHQVPLKFQILLTQNVNGQ